MAPTGSTSVVMPRARPRISRVDVPVPLLLRERGEIVRLFIHPDVPMRNHFLSKVDPRCVVDLPMKATHILLDLLPPHPKSSMTPTVEQRGFIDHRDDRKVLCGYWAQECLRIEGLAETGFWDLSGWDDTLEEEDDDAPGGEGVVVEVDDDDGGEMGDGDYVVVISDDEQRDDLADGDYRGKGGTGGGGAKRRRVTTRRQGAGSSQRSGAAMSSRVGRASASQGTPRTREKAAAARASTTTRGAVRGRGSNIPSSSSRPIAIDTTAIHSDSDDPDYDPTSHNPLSPTSHVPYPTPESNPTPPGATRTLTARQLEKQPRKRRKGLKDLSPAEVQDQFDYFLTFTQKELGQRVPAGVKVGTVNTVKQWMILNVQNMWVEARRKYCRRNLDTMSIMLSTWKTARDYNLSPLALRKHYDATKRVIISSKGPYVPVGERPPNWPFHDKEPINVEAAVPWIYDWTSKECNAFLGRDTAEGEWGGGMAKREEDSETEEEEGDREGEGEVMDGVDDLTGMVSD